MFNCIRNYKPVFQNDCTVYFQFQHLKILSWIPDIYSHLNFKSFYWYNYFTLILICIFLTTNDVEHLSTYWPFGCVCFILWIDIYSAYKSQYLYIVTCSVNIFSILPACSLTLHFHNNFFWREGYNFEEVQFIKFLFYILFFEL